MKPEGEVRLMGAYVVKCEDFIKDANGNVTEIHCSCDLETGGKNPADGRKIKGTIHWVSAKYCEDVDVMLYDRLFTVPNLTVLPEDKSLDDFLNPESLTKLCHCKAEPSIKDAKPGDHFQFVRVGYFTKDSKNENTFNRTVTLKDSYTPSV